MENNGKIIETRAISEPVSVVDRHVSGYAIVFNSESRDLGGFTETISPDAMEGVIERSDVFAKLNHDASRGILARSNHGSGSLTLTVDERGLRYDFDAPDIAVGNELLSYISRGEISASSFAFTSGEEEWDFTSEPYRRTIRKIDKLFDVSPVFCPAYEATTCDRRAIDAYEADKAAKEEARQRMMDAYYDELNRSIND